jgi:hypothetical protein
VGGGRVIDPDLVARRLLGAACPMPATAELDRQHIVVTLDPVTGRMTASGPFPDALSAWVVSDALQRDFQELGDGLPPVRAIPIPLDDPRHGQWELPLPGTVVDPSGLRSAPAGRGGFAGA